VSFGNLPVYLSDFIGREKEIAEVKKLLPTHRLVTLTGAGGSGKTRLSITIASELANNSKKAGLFIQFAPLSDSELVPQAIASTLGIREIKNQPILDNLVEHLMDQHSLLIFDNCEHLIDACAQVAGDLLKACPNLKILATSREPLNISGEVTYALPPMSLPEKQPWQGPKSGEIALSVYQESEAVRLFLNRAALVIPDFELTVDNGGWVAEICRRLDGLPLAIELAAARVRTLSVKQIAERLNDRLNLLTGGSRSLPPRHQTLAATISWSYTLLSGDEQRLLKRLSVFSGGATLVAIEAICTGNGIGKSDVLDRLSELVDKSLVVADQRSGETRYHLLETIREFALDKLEEAQETKSVKDRHLDFFLQFSEEAELKLRGADRMTIIRKLVEERDNLSAAFDWAMASQNADDGLRLASALSFFWAERGYIRERIRWLERALERKPAASLAATANALRSLSLLLITSEEKDFDLVDGLLKESLKLYQELEDKEGVAHVLNYRGFNAMVQKNYVTAKQFLNESLALRRELGTPWNIAHTLQNFATIFFAEGDLNSAKVYIEETIALFQKAGDEYGVARTTSEYADIARMEGDTKHAMEILTRSLSQFIQSGAKWDIGTILKTLAILEIEKNNLKRAAILYGAIHTLQDDLSMISTTNLENELYEKMQTNIQENLSNTDFNQLVEKGRAMSLEQVIEFVSNTSDESAPAQAEKDRLGGLTSREYEAARLIAEGKSNREVAEAMTVSVKTVESYVTRIMRKLRLDSRVQIATWVLDSEPDD